MAPDRAREARSGGDWGWPSVFRPRRYAPIQTRGPARRNVASRCPDPRTPRVPCPIHEPRAAIQDGPVSPTRQRPRMTPHHRTPPLYSRAPGCRQIPYVGNRLIGARHADHGPARRSPPGDRARRKRLLLLGAPIVYEYRLSWTRQEPCGRGGIGRHARFRFWWLTAVGVQVPSPAPKSRSIATVHRSVAAAAPPDPRSRTLNQDRSCRSPKPSPRS